MALQDILDAVTAQANQQISKARTEHQKTVSELLESAERNQARKKQEMGVQKEKKKAQLRLKAESHAQSLRRNAVLKKKRELLDSLYEKIADELAKLPDEKVEPLLRACMKSISAKGSLFPSEQHAGLLKKIAPSEKFEIQKPIKAKGGFLFASKTQEQNFTFEHLVEEWLRPETELEVSKTLFPAS